MRTPTALSLLLALTVATPAAALAEGFSGGGDFSQAATLSEAGWRSYIGQVRGRAANRGGITMAGQPLQRVAFLTITPNDAEGWHAGLHHDFPGVPGVSTSKIRLRGRIAGNKPGPVAVRIESSTNNWVGFVFTLPADGAWMNFDWPLSEAVTQGLFDPAAAKFRLVAAFQETAGPVWKSAGENTLYLAELSVVTTP